MKTATGNQRCVVRRRAAMATGITREKGGGGSVKEQACCFLSHPPSCARIGYRRRTYHARIGCYVLLTSSPLSPSTRGRDLSEYGRGKKHASNGGRASLIIPVKQPNSLLDTFKVHRPAQVRRVT